MFIEIDKNATEYWRGERMSKLEDAISELRKVDVHDRQPVANTLRLLEEHLAETETKDDAKGEPADADHEDRGV